MTAKFALTSGGDVMDYEKICSLLLHEDEERTHTHIYINFLHVNMMGGSCSLRYRMNKTVFKRMQPDEAGI